MNARQNMERLTSGLRTKAEKIRRLGAAGYARQQIADFLGIRYQHVRNVLVDAEKMKKAVEAAHTEAPRSVWRADDTAAAGGFRVRTDGSALIPASVLAAAGFGPGDVLVFCGQGNGEIQVLSRQQALRRAEALMREFVPQGLSLIDELVKGQGHPPAAV
jgi:hypothetical protein